MSSKSANDYNESDGASESGNRGQAEKTQPKNAQGSMEICALKLLVSNNVAGRIIGKAGQSVSQLQSECGCRIKLSQSDHCFPGTHDRVCLLEGKVFNVHLALNAIYEKIREQSMLQHQAPSTEESNGSSLAVSARKGKEKSPTVIVVRLLVPTAACGMLIGKGGSNIKEISDKSNAKIQLAQQGDASAIATAERVVTITGDLEATISCTSFILEEMIAHPEVSKYSNQTTSYSKLIEDDGKPAHNRPPTNRSLDQARQRTNHSENVPIDYHPKSTDQSTLTELFSNRSVASPILNTNSERELTSSLRKMAMGTRSNELTNPPISSVQMTVPDDLVPSIIGRNGTGLHELQLKSGARISFSSRGDFVPGTTNRRVEIAGSMQSCATAQYLISQIVKTQVTLQHQHSNDRNRGDYSHQRRGRQSNM